MIENFNEIVNNKSFEEVSSCLVIRRKNFLKPSRSELGELLSRIYGSCDCFSPDPEISISDEKELKDCAQILLSKLQEE